MPSVTAAEFRRLARSSPWLWRTIEFRWGGGEDEPRHAWIRRPRDLRVEDARGEVCPVIAESGAGRDAADFGWGPQQRPARAEPVFAADGLVDVAPDASGIDYDPFFRDCHWVAMLDPVELADGSPGHDPAVELTDLAVVDHHGREAWQATAQPTPGYDPRCDCCALLGGHLDYSRGAWIPGPPSVIRLDRQTGVCVRTDGGGLARLDVEILAVDQPLDDPLFEQS